MKFLNWMGAEAGAHEESLGDALLAALGCLILAPAAGFGLLTLIVHMGVPQ